MKKYLTPYLRDEKVEDSIYLDLLKFEFDRRIYHFGNHFLSSYESNNFTTLQKFKLFVRDIIIKSKILFQKQISLSPNTLICNSYVSIDNKINSSRFNFVKPPWDLSLNSEIHISKSEQRKILEFKKKLSTHEFNQLLSSEFILEVKEIEKILKNFFSNTNIAGVIFPNDVSFFEKLSLKIIKDLNKKSILYLHGIPGIYSSNLYSHSDHLFVWGEALKVNFEKYGFPSEKINIVGHPLSKQPTNEIKIRNSLENVLILTYSLNGSQFDDIPLLGDRGNSILYLYQIQKTLQKLGVTKVNLRPHPSENKEWYKKYIDNDFFNLDYEKSILKTLENKTLVIGPSSSVFTEALLSGVNYICFDPISNNNEKFQYKVYPPFDGSDSELLTAFSEEELFQLIKNQKLSNINIVKRYLGENYNLDKVLNEIF